MTVLNENTDFTLIFIEQIEKHMIFFFVPGVILDRFAYPEPIFRGRKSKHL